MADPHLLVGLLWVALCLAFVVVTLGVGALVAWLPLMVVGLWFIYRVARAGSGWSIVGR